MQYLPQNKSVILGVIASKFPKMGTIDEMQARVMEVIK